MMHNNETLPKGIESWVELWKSCESLPSESNTISYTQHHTTKEVPRNAMSYDYSFVKEKAFEEMLELHQKLTSKEYQSLFRFIDTLFKSLTHHKEHYLYKKFIELKDGINGIEQR